MHYEQKDIIDFINTFKQTDKQNLEYIFTNGNCYFFALILKELFTGSHIVFSQSESHFLVMYDNHLYDILGDRTKEISIYDLYAWEDMKTIDNAYYNRLLRDCVYLKTR